MTEGHPTPGPDRLLAFHEVGHAVAARLLGHRVGGLQVVGDERLEGTCHLLRLSDDDEGRDLEERILLTCAGMVCEGMASERLGWDESCRDLDQAVRLAVQLVGDCELAVEYLDGVRARLADMFSPHWAAIEALTDELQERRAMSGAEVEAQLDRLVPRSRHRVLQSR